MSRCDEVVLYDTDWLIPGEATRFFTNPYESKKGDRKTLDWTNVKVPGYVPAGYGYEIRFARLEVLGGEPEEQLADTAVAWWQGVGPAKFLKRSMSGRYVVDPNGAGLPLRELECFELVVTPGKAMLRPLVIKARLYGTERKPRIG